jgi:phage baseplate assembly protein W
MKQFLLPLQIEKHILKREDSLKRSIDMFLNVLINTPRYSCVAERDFGFVFNNLRFEIFNEREGVVYDSSTEEGTKEGLRGPLYELKISGSSKNLDTFAAELKEAITRYEPRLTEVAVTMTYVREERRIYIDVKGTIVSTDEKYKYKTIINIWN